MTPRVRPPSGALVFSIEEPVFKTEPLFVLGCTHREFREYVERRFKRFRIAIDEEPEVNAGQMFTFDRPPWRVVWTRKIPRDAYYVGVLAHEIFHLVTRVCQDKCIAIRAQTGDGPGDETAAYLFEYFATRALRRARTIRR